MEKITKTQNLIAIDKMLFWEYNHILAGDMHIDDSYIMLWRNRMIELTRYNDIKFTVNADIIEFVEETPDTVISLTTGKKIIVKESRQEVTNLVISYKKAIYNNLL